MCARRALFVAVVAAGLCAPAGTASAASWSCEASAVRAAVLGQPLPEPIAANKGQAACRPARAAGALLPAPLTSAALAAQTAVTGPANNLGAQTISASGGAADFGVRLLPNVLGSLPVNQVIDAIPAVTVPLTSLPPLPLPLPVGLPSQISVDLRPALRELVGALPSTDLVRIRAAVANASGRCVNGAVRLDGTSQLAGVSVLGQDLPLAGELVTKAVDLISGRTVDPSTIDLSKLGVTGVAPELLTSTLRPVIQAALDALPNIQLPATVAQVSVLPGSQQRVGGRLVQRAVTISATVAGVRLADVIVGEASVGAQDVTCTVGPVNVAAAALQCTTRRLVLTDVVQRGDRVVMTGAADKRFIGRIVRIFFPHRRQYVASALVRKDGTFRTTAPVPERRLRGTNLARYQARLGRERSLRLKLRRRMIVRSVRVSGSRVRISGRVARPLAAPARTIVIKQRVSCRRNKVVARVKPRRDGTFSVTVKAPPRQLAAVYRLGTRVRKNAKNPKTFPTFTLPRYVDLGR